MVLSTLSAGAVSSSRNKESSSQSVCSALSFCYNVGSV